MAPVVSLRNRTAEQRTIKRLCMTNVTTAITYKFCRDLYLTLLCLSYMIIVKLVIQGLPSSLFCRPFA